MAQIIARTEETVVAMTGIRAYPAGLSFILSLRLRNIAVRDKPKLWPFPRNLLEPKQASRRPIGSCAWRSSSPMVAPSPTSTHPPSGRMTGTSITRC